ncbi:hypothetical protein B0H11DRAFT_1929839 [Mycena galericulata]|nr:hypothetical protein B0H11DRAFT_1929839 [Mycena galericulata]
MVCALEWHERMEDGGGEKKGAGKQPVMFASECSAQAIRPSQSENSAVSIRPLTQSQGSSIRWDGLRHLALYPSYGYFTDASFSPRDVLSILRQCFNLETCVLALDVDEGPAENVQPCYMPHLWRLSVVGADRRKYFQNLNLPNLRVLQVSGNSRLAPEQQLTIFPIISSSNRLQHLRLSIAMLSTGALVEILRIAPALKELTLRGEPILPPSDQHWIEQPDDRLVTLLTPGLTPESEAVLCPCLEQLTLLRFKHLSDDALLALILARTDPRPIQTARLSSVRVQFNRLPQVDIIPLIHERIGSDLEVRLDYNPPTPALSRYSLADGNDQFNHWDPLPFTWDGENAKAWQRVNQ